MDKMIVAVDGPVAAGSSSFGKRFAENVNGVFINTGDVYRTIAVYLMEKNINSSDSKKIKEVLDIISLNYKFKSDKLIIYIDGINFVGKLRNHDVSNFVPKISKYSFVRKKVESLQRDILVNANTSIVMEGRNICTEIIPDADYKFFVYASFLERVRRRFYKERRKGNNISFFKVLIDTYLRDFTDSHRKCGNFKRAKEAILIDTTFVRTCEGEADKFYNEIK